MTLRSPSIVTRENYSYVNNGDFPMCKLSDNTLWNMSPKQWLILTAGDTLYRCSVVTEWRPTKCIRRRLATSNQDRYYNLCVNDQHYELYYISNQRHTYEVTVHWNCSSVMPSADCNIHQWSQWKCRKIISTIAIHLAIQHLTASIFNKIPHFIQGN